MKAAAVEGDRCDEVSVVVELDDGEEEMECASAGEDCECEMAISDDVEVTLTRLDGGISTKTADLHNDVHGCQTITKLTFDSSDARLADDIDLPSGGAGGSGGS